MRKTLTGVVAVIAISLAGCTTSSDNANTENYPREAKDNFVDMCVAEAGKARPGDEKQRRTDCRCIVDRLEDRLPYDRKGDGATSFKDADTAIKDNESLPDGVQDDLDRATADCVQDR